MEELPPEQGLAIRLKYVENQTLAEIAERFGVPPQHREKPHPRRRCQAAAAIPFDRKDGAR